jgi:UDP-3-O-[3-hydroxymyristoyl] glucosamine N-acyltransferase
MKLSELNLHDSGIKLISNHQWPEEILAICTFDSLSENGMLFIKNAKFLQKFMAVLENAIAQKIGVIIEDKFYSQIDQNSKAFLEKLPWIAISSNVALSLTILSKPFYDKKFGSMNTQVDGRQMGTTEIHPTARISQNVFIGENVKVGAFVEIMPGSVIMPNVDIAENSKIFPNVTIYPFTKIGKNCRIHSGTVIGSDGYGYTFHQGQHKKIWHMGGVEIHDDVEIGSNSSIDMGTFSPTIIGPGTRIDNQVQVAHNVKLGRGVILCGQVGIAGSAVLEDFVVCGGKAAIGPDAHIGMGSQLAGGAVVTDGSWPAGSKLGGHPARDLKEWLKGLAYLRKVSLGDSKRE